MGESMANITLGQIAAWGAGILGVLSIFLEVSKIKINPWTWLARKIGRAINGEVMDKVDKLEKTVQGMKQDAAEQAAVNCRSRILRFGDEVIHGTRHSKDHFDQILDDITRYERYCRDHPEFENNMTVITSERIKTIYAKCLEENDFL